MLFKLFSLDRVCTMLKIVLPVQSFSDPSTILVVILGFTLENFVLFCLTNSSLCCNTKTLFPTLNLLPTNADNIIVLPAPVGATTIVFLCLSKAVEASSTAISWYGLKILFVFLLCWVALRHRCYPKPTLADEKGVLPLEI